MKAGTGLLTLTPAVEPGARWMTTTPDLDLAPPLVLPFLAVGPRVSIFLICKVGILVV